MRLAFAFFLFAAFACHGEDVPAGVQKAFRDRDASLDWFSVIAAKPLDANSSVMLVRAAPTQLDVRFQQRNPVYELMQAGVFVVSAKTRKVEMVIDIFTDDDAIGLPALDQPNSRSVCLHFYDPGYGIYHSSVKYFYDLPTHTRTAKIPFGLLSMTSSARRNGQLIYSADYGQWTQGRLDPKYASIAIEPAQHGAALPAPRIVSTPSPEESQVKTEAFSGISGQRLVVRNRTPPGQPEQPSGIEFTTASGDKKFIPSPIPTMTLRRSLLPQAQEAGGGLENAIGPYAFDGRKIWFANTFYDGEGFSGVGAIGAFDAVTQQFDMRYLPEIAPWSGSAILLDGDDVWVGLMHRPEGAEYSGGLLCYNRKTGAVTKYAVADLIHTIDRVGGTIYCGTSNGLYTIHDAAIRQFRFEPDEAGKLIMTENR